MSAGRRLAFKPSSSLSRMGRLYASLKSLIDVQHMNGTKHTEVRSARILLIFKFLSAHRCESTTGTATDNVTQHIINTLCIRFKSVRGGRSDSLGLAPAASGCARYRLQCFRDAVGMLRAGPERSDSEIARTS